MPLGPTGWRLARDGSSAIGSWRTSSTPAYGSPSSSPVRPSANAAAIRCAHSASTSTTSAGGGGAASASALAASSIIGAAAYAGAGAGGVAAGGGPAGGGVPAPAYGGGVEMWWKTGP